MRPSHGFVSFRETKTLFIGEPAGGSFCGKDLITSNHLYRKSDGARGFLVQRTWFDGRGVRCEERWIDWRG